jgi:hypothetical protein
MIPWPTSLPTCRSASHDLTAALEQGRFRQDLFYRLCIVVLSVPPLLGGRNRCVKQRSGLDTVDGAGRVLGCGKARRNVIAAHGAQDPRPQGAFAL